MSNTDFCIQIEIQFLAVPQRTLAATSTRKTSRASLPDDTNVDIRIYGSYKSPSHIRILTAAADRVLKVPRTTTAWPQGASQAKTVLITPVAEQRPRGRAWRAISAVWYPWRDRGAGQKGPWGSCLCWTPHWHQRGSTSSPCQPTVSLLPCPLPWGRPELGKQRLALDPQFSAIFIL